MKILITGAPGTGKTTLVEYATKLDYDNFFDTDKVPGLCEWRDYATGKVIGDIGAITPTGDEQWYKTNGWYWKQRKMDELLSSTANPVVCGSADNVMDYYSSFDRIIFLRKSREDIVSNLTQPGREQPNGKDTAHHDRILRWQDKLSKSLESFNPYIVSDNTVAVMFEKVLDVLDGHTE